MVVHIPSRHPTLHHTPRPIRHKGPTPIPALQLEGPHNPNDDLHRNRRLHLPDLDDPSSPYLVKWKHSPRRRRRPRPTTQFRPRCIPSPRRRPSPLHAPRSLPPPIPFPVPTPIPLHHPSPPLPTTHLPRPQKILRNPRTPHNSHPTALQTNG